MRRETKRLSATTAVGGENGSRREKSQSVGESDTTQSGWVTYGDRVDENEGLAKERLTVCLSTDRVFEAAEPNTLGRIHAHYSQ